MIQQDSPSSVLSPWDANPSAFALPGAAKLDASLLPNEELGIERLGADLH